MDITIKPSTLAGTVRAPSSKSQLHRLLICASFADKPTLLRCQSTNRDVEATAFCLNALGARIHWSDPGYTVYPAQQIPGVATLPCGESGATLRFLLPVVGALGVDATFVMEGRLPHRPLKPLWEEMERMGCTLTRPTANTLRCQGQLRSGNYQIDGSVSSQFMSGLMLGLNLLQDKSFLATTGRSSSAPYIELTKQVLSAFGADPLRPGGNRLRSVTAVNVEGDWSSAAFFLTANALGSKVQVTGLRADSLQGDRVIPEILDKIKEGSAFIDISDIPDLVPVLAVAAAFQNGAVFTKISRLRQKESDRVASICAMICALGGKAEATEDSLRVFASPLTGGTVNACNDHRIAMAAAIAATAANDSVTVLGAECVEKSYPGFWADYTRLGGKYEQHIW